MSESTIAYCTSVEFIFAIIFTLVNRELMHFVKPSGISRKEIFFIIVYLALLTIQQCVEIVIIFFVNALSNIYIEIHLARLIFIYNLEESV